MFDCTRELRKKFFDLKLSVNGLIQSVFSA